MDNVSVVIFISRCLYVFKYNDLEAVWKLRKNVTPASCRQSWWHLAANSSVIYSNWREKQINLAAGSHQDSRLEACDTITKQLLIEET